LHAAQRGDLTPDQVAALTAGQQRTLLTLLEYEQLRRDARRAAYSRSNRRAFALLRSFLTSEQLRTLQHSRYFHVQGSAGGTYRLCVRTGVVQRVERHRSRWYWMATFCLHDYAEDAPDKKRVPIADLALQHMLLLMADEPAFLSAANVSTSARRLWDGEWLRELRAAQAERDAVARAAAIEQRERQGRPRLRLEVDAEGDWFVCTNEDVAA
jgi:hypothetical protein